MPWLLTTLLVIGAAISGSAQPAIELDIAALDPDASAFQRVAGSVGTGTSGLPVAGGHDCDGDGFEDVAFGAASPSRHVHPSRSVDVAVGVVASPTA